MALRRRDVVPQTVVSWQRQCSQLQSTAQVQGLPSLQGVQSQALPQVQAPSASLQVQVQVPLLVASFDVAFMEQLRVEWLMQRKHQPGRKD